jgi:hypothetical protein
VAGIRAWLAAAVACALLVPAAAWAASPGDKVAFEIPDTDRGDAYTISVDREKAAEGVDDTDEPGISGEFAMPDLGGKAREVSVLIEVTRAADGSSRAYKSKIDYTPAGSEGAQPASKPASPRPAAPAKAPSAPAAKPHQPVIVPPPATPAAPVPQPAKPVDPSDSGGQILRTPERILHGLTGAAPLRHRGTPVERRRAKRHARRARRKANRFRAGPDPVAPKARSLSPPRDTRADLSGDSFPGLGYSVAWKLLAAVAAAGLLLPFLVAARTHMRRRREAAMEAELQEMVSEARAGAPLRR